MYCGCGRLQLPVFRLIDGMFVEEVEDMDEMTAGLLVVVSGVHGIMEMEGSRNSRSGSLTGRRRPISYHVTLYLDARQERALCLGGCTERTTGSNFKYLGTWSFRPSVNHICNETIFCGSQLTAAHSRHLGRRRCHSHVKRSPPRLLGPCVFGRHCC